MESGVGMPGRQERQRKEIGSPDPASHSLSSVLCVCLSRHVSRDSWCRETRAREPASLPLLCPESMLNFSLFHTRDRRCRTTGAKVVRPNLGLKLAPDSTVAVTEVGRSTSAVPDEPVVRTMIRMAVGPRRIRRSLSFDEVGEEYGLTAES